MVNEDSDATATKWTRETRSLRDLIMCWGDGHGGNSRRARVRAGQKLNSLTRLRAARISKLEAYNHRPA